MAAKFPTIHVSSNTHKVLKRASKDSGFKIMPLVDRIIDAWDRGEVFYLPESLHCATQQEEGHKK